MESRWRCNITEVIMMTMNIVSFNEQENHTALITFIDTEVHEWKMPARGERLRPLHTFISGWPGVTTSAGQLNTERPP